MALSNDGKSYQKVIEKAGQADTVRYKFLLENGDWVLNDQLPTIPDENGLLNHKIDFGTESLDAAMEEALDPHTHVESGDHAPRPEQNKTTADLGKEIIDENTPNNAYSAESRNSSSSGAGLVDADQSLLRVGERHTSESSHGHDSHLNPAAPAFNPVAQPFVPSSNVPRHSHSSSRSSHRQRSQSRSRNSHSRSSSVASQQRPRSGSSVRHEELNPSAHEFKPQFAQPTHHVAHASGYAAALKKPASPPLKDEFKKPHAPPSKPGKPRSMSSVSIGSEPVGPAPSHSLNGHTSDNSTSYAQMARQAVQDGLDKKQPAASDTPIIQASTQEAAVSQHKDPALTDDLLKAGANGLAESSFNLQDSDLETRREDTRDLSEAVAESAGSKSIPGDLEHVTSAAKSETLQGQESTLDPMVENLKTVASEAKVRTTGSHEQPAETSSKDSTPALEEVLSSIAKTAQSAQDQGSTIDSAVKENIAHASDTISENFESAASAIAERFDSPRAIATSQAQNVKEQVASAKENAQTQANAIGTALNEQIESAKESVVVQAKAAERTGNEVLEPLQDMTSRVAETVQQGTEPATHVIQQTASKAASVLDEATESVQNAMKDATAQVNDSLGHLVASLDTSADNHARESSGDSRIDSIDLSSENYDAEQILLMDEVCIMLDRDDRPIGSVSKKDAHLMTNINAGLLHRAFSLFIFNSDNKLLLQQRASEKITFPNMWTNTCCSHPLSIEGEVAEDLSGSIAGVKVAARRKVEQELGIQAIDAPVERMEFLTRIHYLAPSDGQWGEHEIDYILFLRSDAELKINPNEVQDEKWVSQDDLREMFKSPELTYTPWFKLICETFLFKWWDNLADLTPCKDETTIHRLGLEPELYAKIAHSEESTETSEQNPTDSTNLATTIRDKAAEATSLVSQQYEAVVERGAEVKNNLASGVASAKESLVDTLSGIGSTEESIRQADPETSEPAAEHSLPISSPTPAVDFDDSAKIESSITREDISSEPRITETSEPAAEDSDLPLVETRDAVESEVQESFGATKADADAAQPSKRPDAVLEVTSEGQARAAAHTEAESSDVSRPSTGKSLRANQNFFFYIFNTLFGGIFKGLSTIFDKLAFWRKSPHP